MHRLCDTETASLYLAECGVPRSPATLRKLRCVGGGPRFRRLNGKPLYATEDLDGWIEERLSPPASSNAEANANAEAGED